MRVAVPDRADAASPCHGFVPIKNRPPDEAVGPAALMVSLDALAFVRFGLRAADDPRIVNTVKVVDATLKVDTPRSRLASLSGGRSTASTRTAGHSTEPASVAPGRC